MQSIQTKERATQQRRSGLRWLFLALVLAGLTAGGAWVYLQVLRPKPKVLELPIAAAKTQTVEITVSESGTVEWGGQQSLKSPGEVTVDRVFVAVGDRIQKGQQLIILRSKQQQNSFEAQQRQIRAREITLTRNRQKVQEARDRLQKVQLEAADRVKQQVEIDKQAITIERSRQKVEEAQIKIEAETKQLRNTETLAEKGFVPGDEVDQKREALRSARSGLIEAQLDVKTQILELQKLQLDSQQRSEQQDKILTAKAAILDAENAVETDIQEIDRLRIEQKDRATEALNNVITAPMSGKILDLRVKAGDGVKTGEILVTLGDPDQELIKLQLGTLDAAQVKVGQEARIKVIGPASDNYTGRIISLNPQAIAGDGSGLGGTMGGRGSSEQARVPGVVQLDRPTGKLIPGSQVSVEIITQQRRNVVALDLETVQRGEGEPFVWVQDAQKRAQKRPVKLGLEGVTQVEIVKGLKVGDRVISIPPDAAIEPGLVVKAGPAGPPASATPPP